MQLTCMYNEIKMTQVAWEVQGQTCSSPRSKRPYIYNAIKIKYRV